MWVGICLRGLEVRYIILRMLFVQCTAAGLYNSDALLKKTRSYLKHSDPYFNMKIQGFINVLLLAQSVSLFCMFLYFHGYTLITARLISKVSELCTSCLKVYMSTWHLYKDISWDPHTQYVHFSFSLVSF